MTRQQDAAGLAAAARSRRRRCGILARPDSYGAGVVIKPIPARVDGEPKTGAVDDLDRDARVDHPASGNPDRHRTGP
jgi:hypothetical protein